MIMHFPSYIHTLLKNIKMEKKTLSSRPVGGVTVDTRILYAVCDLRRSDQVNYSKYK